VALPRPEMASFPFLHSSLKLSCHFRPRCCLAALSLLARCALAARPLFLLSIADLVCISLLYRRCLATMPKRTPRAKKTTTAPPPPETPPSPVRDETPVTPKKKLVEPVHM
jgi:hypothetical protein